MRVLIIGCGYIGRGVGLELARLGHEVHGLRRTAVAEEGGVRPLTGDVTKQADLKGIGLPFDWVVNTVSSGQGGAKEYREAYVAGTKNILDWLGGAPPKKYVYTSSTSVYGQTDGSQVKETSPAQPGNELGQALLDAEKLLLDAAGGGKFPAVILRVAGIYGPERGHLFRQYLRDEARIAGKGERLINMIHRDDVAGSIITALKSGRTGEIYNVVDDEPTTQIHFFRWLSETLGKNMPAFSDEPAGDRKRPPTQKKVMNRKLRMELGYQLRYPTFRQGYTAEIQRLQDAGQLDLTAAPR